MANTILVFAPHPDDEVLGCGGAIASKIAEGSNIYIVFMTDGCHYNSQLPPDLIKTIRRKEAIDAGNVFGIPEANLIFLDFEDGQLKTSKKAARNIVKEILCKKQPVEVFYPGMLDLHSDHRATRSIVDDCLKSLKIKPTLWQYVIWFFSGFKPRLLPFLILDFIDRKRKRKRLIKLDISEFLYLKKEALFCYKSQTTGIMASNPPLPDSFIKKFLKRYEEFQVQLGKVDNTPKK